MIWKLLGWLFRRKPEALPSFEETLLASYQKEKGRRHKEAKKREKEEQKRLDKIAKENQKKRDELAKLEAKGADPFYVKRAFDLIGKLLASESGMTIHIHRDLLEMTREQFKAFRKPFVELCQTMGLKVVIDYDHWLIITWEDALAYKERLENETPKSITTSVYR